MTSAIEKRAASILNDAKDLLLSGRFSYGKTGAVAAEFGEHRPSMTKELSRRYSLSTWSVGNALRAGNFSPRDALAWWVKNGDSSIPVPIYVQARRVDAVSPAKAARKVRRTRQLGRAAKNMFGFDAQDERRPHVNKALRRVEAAIGVDPTNPAVMARLRKSVKAGAAAKKEAGTGRKTYTHVIFDRPLRLALAESLAEAETGLAKFRRLLVYGVR